MTVERYKTRFGDVFHSSTCRDNWHNIRTRPARKRFLNGSNTIPFTELTLQGPAIESIKAVERDISGPFIRQYIRVTGSIRTCEQQMALWLSDKSRFAHPNSTLHTQGLAIDVHTDFLSAKLKNSLLKHGWHQSRPDDEPWHFSYRLEA